MKTSSGCVHFVSSWNAQKKTESIPLSFSGRKKVAFVALILACCVFFYWL
jgi:hypothetical protein